VLFRSVRNEDLPDGASVREAIDACGVSPSSAAVALNGHAISGDDLDRTISDGDELHVCPRAKDPGTIVLIAIAVVSAVVSASLAANIEAPSAGDDGETRFGFSRFSNDAVAGEAIPVVLGPKPRYGGKVISRIPIESPDGSGDSRVKILICLSHGVINKIADRFSDFDNIVAGEIDGVYFNDQPISSFPDVRISGRMGNDQQTVLANFADTETLVEVGVGGTPLEPDVPFLFTTTAPVNAVVVRIRFPDGVFSIASSGQLDLREVRYRIRARLNAIEEEGARECGDGEYCPNPIDDEQYQLPLGGDGSGPGPWTEWSEFVVTQAQQSSFFAAPRLDSLSPSGIPVTVDIQVERITALPPDVTSRDRMLWDSIVQISYSDNSYGGYALLAIEAKASEQLQDVPRVSVDIEGQIGRAHV